MEIKYAVSPRHQRYLIEGPSKAGAVRMNSQRIQWLAMAEAALARGADVEAGEFDMDAWEIEMDLIKYGYAELIVGKKA